eukprot:CAMPEP_0182800698 /NCGR_PEP_ID=MMETSP0006_2-20121128/2551_1 /TAXON_ID=97485 /ORGANISM="Prymnesium parvum, Strain Texoma1" /LENGTH=127 /DNA_ID=CAMNT_0024925957 /DNA_START=195 /DNA_END=579 /DNA_ORIENTATION=-
MEPATTSTLGTLTQVARIRARSPPAMGYRERLVALNEGASPRRRSVERREVAGDGDLEEHASDSDHRDAACACGRAAVSAAAPNSSRQLNSGVAKPSFQLPLQGSSHPFESANRVEPMLTCPLHADG